jgi:acetyl esterase
MMQLIDGGAVIDNLERLAFRHCEMRASADPCAAFAVIEGPAGHLDPAAARIAERLDMEGPVASDDLTLLRRRYTASRWSLLAPKPPVESVFQVRSSRMDVPPLTFIRPHGSFPGKSLPALVYLHGGGWTLGGLETYEPLCRELANALGRVVIWVEYRLAPEHPFPAALEDAWNALEWVCENANWLGIDLDRIAVGGDGAGGNLTAVTCHAVRNGIIRFDPEFQLLIYPCVDLTASAPSHQSMAEDYPMTAERYGWYRHNYVGGFPDLTDWHLSPQYADGMDGLAPAVIVNAGFAPVRDEVSKYGMGLHAARVPVRMLYFAGMIQGFMTMGGALHAAQTAVSRIAASIDELIV